MTRTGIIKIFKKLHRWPSVIIALFAMIFAFSGIIMNHRETFSKIDIPRKLLPWNYRYKNWNLAAVRGSLHLKGDTSIIYGNIGTWLTTDDFGSFTDFNEGFPSGIDNRKIYSLTLFNDTILVAGTHFGVYFRPVNGKRWLKTDLQDEEDRIADLGMKGDTLLILTRNYLYKTTGLSGFAKYQLPAFEGYEKKTGLFNTLWELHSGELWGITGILIVDLLGIAVVLLSFTGLLHFFFPGIIRRRKEKSISVEQLKSFKKKNLRWHNVAGYIFALFLIINTTAGMFLRPPLLIPIADKTVGIIPHTHLDTPNPWFDKLRRICWDENLKKYIISTTDGFSLADETLKNPLVPCPVQPPVSVMGCNVFEQVSQNSWMVGSFSGIFLWNVTENTVVDYFTGYPYKRPEGIGKPIGENMASGLVKTNNKGTFWFDYNSGAKALLNPGIPVTVTSGMNFTEMPVSIIKNSPMSLWNVALEFHTGRIFEHLIGPFYILYVPIAGLCLLTVLISGFMLWWMVYRKKKK